MIKCKICEQEFRSCISWKHLAKHGLTTAQYQEQYGDTVTDEFRALRSDLSSGEKNGNFGKRREWTEEQKDKIRGREPHNKGKKLTDPTVLENLRSGIAERERKYASGELIRVAQSLSEEHKEKVRQYMIEFSKNNPDKVRERTLKSLETKRARGYDFSSNFKNRKSPTVEQIEQFRQLGQKNAAERRGRSNNDIRQKLQEERLTLKTDINEYSFDLQCQVCNTEFQFTRQYFHPCKFKGNICPRCHPRATSTSKKETDLFEYIRSLMPGAIQGYRQHYRSKEIDIYIPELKIGFELNGLYWHSEQVMEDTGRSATHDHEKLLEFKNQGIRVIQIFEDEWDFKTDIVKSRIANILNKSDEVIYARKCSVFAVDSKTASAFCEANHIMGRGRSNERLGLFYNNELVSLMTFSKSNLSRKVEGWEINRFSSKLGYSVVGGASKLFKEFLRIRNPERVISYSDNRWSDGGLYEKLGFQLETNGTPGYWYFLPNDGRRIHRFSLRKNSTDDPNLTEAENRKQQGYGRIWDSGSSRWVWSK